MHSLSSCTAIAGALATALVSSPTPAQHPAAPPVAALRASAHGLQSTADGLVGFGTDWSARFAADGVRFIPALGPTAPGTHWLGLRTVTIRHGATELPVATNVTPSQRRDRAVYERAPAIEEHYEVRQDGLEQSFVFRELPGHGDLVVRCELDGGLAGFGAATATGLAFASPGLGGVTIGGVTGIDANGDRCPGSLRLTDGGLELALPAAFVDRAALPLVLDPLLGARLDLTSGPADDNEPDVAYDSNSGDFCVVWTRTVSAVVGEVYARFYHETTGLGPTLLLGSSQVVRRARIASHNAVDRFLVVWEASTAVIAAAKLTGVTIDPGRVLGVAFDVTAWPAHCTDADLSGNPGTSANDRDGVLVYRRTGVGHEAIAYTVPAGTGAPTFAAPTLLGTDPEAGPAKVSKAGNGTRLVAWSLPHWVVVQPVDETGAPVGSGDLVATAMTVAARVDVDGRNGSFVVVHEDQAAVGNRDVKARQYTVAGTTTTLAATAAVSTSTNDELQPTIALLGPKYVVAWTRVVNLLDSVVVAKSLAPTGCLACGVEQTVTGALQSEVHPAIGSKVAGGTEAPTALIAVASHATTTPYQGDIAASLFTAFATTTSTALWNGCGNAATLTLVGSLSIGSTSTQFRLATNDPQASLGVFAFGFGGATIQCGTCTFVNPVASVFAPLVGGSANHPMALPCSAPLIGVAIDAQAAVLGAITNQCPQLPTGSATPARRYVVAE